MRKKFFILFFIITICFISLLYLFNSNNNSKDSSLSHLFFAQYIQLKNKTINWSLPNTNFQSKTNQSDTTLNQIPPQKKHFISFSGCETLTQNPDTLSKKLQKDRTKNTTNNSSSLFQKMGCGLIQTIIPLSF